MRGEKWTRPEPIEADFLGAVPPAHCGGGLMRCVRGLLEGESEGHLERDGGVLGAQAGRDLDDTVAVGRPGRPPGHTDSMGTS